MNINLDETAFVDYKTAINKENRDEITNLLDKSFDDEDANEPYNLVDFGIQKKYEIREKIRDKNPVTSLTLKILKVYKTCSSTYSYDESMKPKRALTDPEIGKT